MSSQNSFPRPAGARPATTPSEQERLRQPSWVNPQAQPGFQQQQPDVWNPEQGRGSAYQQGAYNQQGGYGEQAAPPQDYGHWGALQSGQGAQPAPSQSDPYAPQFEPYVAPGRSAYGRQPQATGYGQQPGANEWPGRSGASGSGEAQGFDAHSFDAAGYGGQAYAPGQAQNYGDGYRESELSSADWAGQPSEFAHGDFAHGAYQQHGQGGTDLGFATAEGGDLDPAYAEDDGEYEDEEAPRSRRPVKIVMALVGAILLGGGVAYGYKTFSNSGPQGEPPIIKSEGFPSKTKPADAGGKTFPYSDTKIMGRLGDGTSSASASEASDQGAPAAQDAPPAEPDDAANNGGPRKVSTLVVGRDGSIQQPPDMPEPSSQVAVPGTSLVDAFGQGGGGASHDAPPRLGNSASDAAAPAPVKKVAPVKVAKINSVSAAGASATGSLGDSGEAAAAPAPTKKLKKVARAETATASDAYSPEASAPVTSSGGGAGYVAVLASVPHSASSRIDALKRFADMQQKYASALAGKTPDIATANLGAKGNFDRLVVGPPGSRQEANSVCSELKAQGYSNCWVTSY